MTGLVVGLIVALIALICLLAYMADALVRAHADDRAEHAMCIAHVADVTSKRIVAQSLRQYAIQWDSTAEIPNLRQLAREQYKPGGPPMPSIWLNQQADLLEQGVSDE